MENNYQLSRIHNYVSGLMSKEDMYSLEREALEDPFLQDAIDGYKLQNGVDINQLSLLQKRLSNRLHNYSDRRDIRFYNWQRLAIGLTAGVMFITVCTLLVIRYFPKQSVSTFREVIVSESVYDYSVVPFRSENDVIPTGGWGELYKILHSGYGNNQSYKGTLDIRFEIDSNKNMSNIRVSGEGYEYDEELVDLLRNKIQWNGSKAHFVLEIKALNL